jgi:hypothetical protein
VDVLDVPFEVRRLVVFAVADRAGVVLLAGVVEHVHLQVAFVDEGLVTLAALDFRLGLMVADGVEFQRALGFEELIADRAGVVSFGAVSVLDEKNLVKLLVDQLNRLTKCF